MPTKSQKSFAKGNKKEEKKKRHCTIRRKCQWSDSVVLVQETALLNLCFHTHALLDKKKEDKKDKLHNHI